MRDHLSRRQFLWHAGGGLGGIALAELLARDDLLAGTDKSDVGTRRNENVGKAGHC